MVLSVLAAACGGGDSSSSTDGGAAGAGGSAGPSTAEVRFAYQAEWKDHLGACASIADYRIKLGASPLPITVPIDATPGAVGAYVKLEGRKYADADVLHVFTCVKSQTSKQSLEGYGRFGIDLGLSPGKRYTVTLGGTVATLVEDP